MNDGVGVFLFVYMIIAYNFFASIIYIFGIVCFLKSIFFASFDWLFLMMLKQQTVTFEYTRRLEK